MFGAGRSLVPFRNVAVRQLLSLLKAAEITLASAIALKSPVRELFSLAKVETSSKKQPRSGEALQEAA